MHGRVFRLGSHPDLCETRKVLATGPHSPQCDRGLPVAASPLREPHACGEEGVTPGGTAGRLPGGQGGLSLRFRSTLGRPRKGETVL